jgi:hypothetical protein
MIALGIEAHVAVATNMLALTLMSVGGSLPFMGKGVLNRSRLVPSIVLTIIGSGLGALALLTGPLKALQITNKGGKGKTHRCFGDRQGSHNRHSERERFLRGGLPYRAAAPPLLRNRNDRLLRDEN